ncbi:MAG: 50S ribosome-binding GTPase [Mobilicoccus sp.]|nr:50S ribosome-binding GTPase [Mobilicoccus sp.]
MSRRRDRHHAAPSPEQLGGAVTGLITALDAGGDQLPADRVASAQKVLRKASERLDIAGNHTIVALAGATGSGKSSMFNRIVGAAVSTVGMLRPTTTTITSAVWGPDPATELLDWVGSASRHRVTPEKARRSGAGDDLDGLVLLDLPDVDSHRLAHRAEADRVLALADVFVWVTDPQKYADGILHEDYLRRMRAHEAVTLVVLNQIDRLAEDEVRACRTHLQTLLVEDGLPNAEVIAVSARTGEGLEDLRAALAGAVGAATASRVRLVGDLRSEAEALREHVGDSEVELSTDPDDALVSALARTAGVPIVLDSVGKDYRRSASSHTGWPPTRWLKGTRADPLRRFRLAPVVLPTATAKAVGRKLGRGEDPGEADEIGAVLARSSLPEPTPAARAAVATLIRSRAAAATVGLPPAWADAVEAAAGPDERDLADTLDQAIVATPLREKNPWWWYLVGALHWVLLAAATVGLLWLMLLWGMSAVQLPLPDTPTYSGVPVPTGLLVGGVLAGLLVAFLCLPLVRAGARRRRARVERRLRAAIGHVASTRLLAPQQEVLRRHAVTRENLDLVGQLGR